jgi:hypothetical protein
MRNDIRISNFGLGTAHMIIFNVGDIVAYKAHGSTTDRHVLVTHLMVERGRPGFDGVIVSQITGEPIVDHDDRLSNDKGQLPVWGYAHQVHTVIDTAAATRVAAYIGARA